MPRKMLVNKSILRGIAFRVLPFNRKQEHDH